MKHWRRQRPLHADAGSQPPCTSCTTCTVHRHLHAPGALCTVHKIHHAPAALYALCKLQCAQAATLHWVSTVHNLASQQALCAGNCALYYFISQCTVQQSLMPRQNKASQATPWALNSKLHFTARASITSPVICALDDAMVQRSDFCISQREWDK